MIERNASRCRLGFMVAIVFSMAAAACGGNPSPSCDDWEARTLGMDDWESRNATPDKSAGGTHCDPQAPTVPAPPSTAKPQGTVPKALGE